MTKSKSSKRVNSMFVQSGGPSLMFESCDGDVATVKLDKLKKYTEEIKKSAQLELLKVIEDLVAEIQTELHNGRMETTYKLTNNLLSLLQSSQEELEGNTPSNETNI